MEAHPGDHIRLRVEGGRRPPLEGVVMHIQSCESVTGGTVVIVRRDDDGRLAWIPSCSDLVVLGAAPA